MPNFEEELNKRVAKIEADYRNHFDNLQEQVFTQVKNFMAESITNNAKVSPELEAEVSTYRPVIESIVRSLKESGILNKSEDVNINEAVTIISELTEAVSDQTRKIKDLQKMLRIHELINQELNGLDKKIVQEALNHFQGEDLEGDELSKKLIEFVSKRKPGNKAVQFESINLEDELDGVSAILENKDPKKKDVSFKPTKKIDIKGLAKRVVTESVALNLNESEDDSEQSDEVKQFMKDFEHLS